MEVASVATQAPPEPQPSHDGASEATRSTEELFQWSGYVHVGAGADECEHAIDGACEHAPRVNPETAALAGHFHAWVCLPNPYQIRDISDKARAAKARKTRALRDPDSDSGAVLEMEMDELRREQFDDLLKVIARRSVDERVVEIIEDIKGDERFEHYDQDAEELRRLFDTPEDQRDTEEFDRLQADMEEYGAELERRMDAQVEREEARLRGRSVDEVIEIERKYRIESIATETYLHTYYTWSMYIGAREPTIDGLPSVRKLRTPEELRNASPEVVKALREKISELERRVIARSDAAGN